MPLTLKSSKKNLSFQAKREMGQRLMKETLGQKALECFKDKDSKYAKDTAKK